MARKNRSIELRYLYTAKNDPIFSKEKKNYRKNNLKNKIRGTTFIYYDWLKHTSMKTIISQNELVLNTGIYIYIHIYI